MAGEIPGPVPTRRSDIPSNVPDRRDRPDQHNSVSRPLGSDVPHRPLAGGRFPRPSIGPRGFGSGRQGVDTVTGPEHAAREARGSWEPADGADRSGASGKFNEVDPRLDSLKQDLEADPERAEAIAALFATPLNTERSRIITVRTDDVGTVVRNLLNGSIPIEARYDNFMGRRMHNGWFYTTPVFSNEFFDDKPDLVGNSKRDPLNMAVQGSTSEYGEKIAFATGFSQNVIPVLEADWRDELYTQLQLQRPGEYDDPSIDINHPRVTEGILVEIKHDLDMYALDGRDMNTFLETPGDEQIFPSLSGLARHISGDVDKNRVLNYVYSLARDRGGVVLGFDSSLLGQGEYLTRATDERGVTHGEELVLLPAAGQIDLKSVVAAEGLGVYEDKFLSYLDLRRDKVST